MFFYIGKIQYQILDVNGSNKYSLFVVLTKYS
jgi:hypothetical protein